MTQPRRIPLFDPRSQPSSWNQRMAPGEFAILYSSLQGAPSTLGHVCDIFPSLLEAEASARAAITADPALRCRIYDREGLAHPPLRQIAGPGYKGESELTPRLRRWTGAVLFAGGILLTLVDWAYRFTLSWPSTLGMRIAPVGLLLLVTEVAIYLTARQHAKRSKQQR